MNAPLPAKTAIQTERELLAVYEVRDALMKRHAYTEDLATEVAYLCINTLSTLSDEELVQVAHRARRAKREARDAQIRAELRPGNAEQVAKRHGLKRTQVYEIARRRPPK